VLREVISWAMRKLGVEEWALSAVMSMYTGAKTAVRIVFGNSKGFEVKVCMHQGSALSPLLFVIVIEAISREFRVALPWELQYVDDLAVIAETGEKAVRWPCEVCSKGVGSNSLQCTSCQKCSGIKGSMSKVAKSFICRGCLNPLTSTGRTSVDIGASAELELVDKFCYRGNVLSVDGDADAAVEARIRISWYV